MIALLMQKPQTYRSFDEYTIGLLRNRYLEASANERALMIERSELPGEVIVMAIRDQSELVRTAVAKHWHMNCCLPDGSDAKSILRSDSSLLVRAAVLENPKAITIWDCHQLFYSATHVERLALIRNPEISESLVEKVFDVHNTEWNLNFQQRAALVSAFLSNPKLQKYNQEDQWDIHFDNLWRNISKCPNSLVKQLVYRHIRASDHVKVQAFQLAASEEIVRCEIVDGCAPADRHTLFSALKDGLEEIRIFAFRNIDLSSDQFETLLQENDRTALKQLATNKHLSHAHAQKLHDRLDALDEKDAASVVRWKIWELEGKIAPRDPIQLFGPEGRRGKFLEEKIDFIGTHIAQLRKNILADQKELWKEGYRIVAYTILFLSLLSLAYLSFKWLAKTLWHFLAG